MSSIFMRFLRFCRGMMDRGGFATVGLFGVLLFKNGRVPSYVGQIAYGISAVGTCGFIRFIIKDMGRIDCDGYIRDLKNIKIAMGHEGLETALVKEQFGNVNMQDLLDGWLREKSRLKARVDEMEYKVKYAADFRRMPKEANERYTSFQNIHESEQMKMVLRKNLETLRNEMARGGANEPHFVGEDMLTPAELSWMHYLDKIYSQALRLLNESGTKTLKEIFQDS